MSLKFVPEFQVDSIPASVQKMAWHRPGDKLLSESMLVSLLTHICVTRPQSVNATSLDLSQHLSSDQLKKEKLVIFCFTDVPIGKVNHHFFSYQGDLGGDFDGDNGYPGPQVHDDQPPIPPRNTHAAGRARRDEIVEHYF